MPAVPSGKAVAEATPVTVESVVTAQPEGEAVCGLLPPHHSIEITSGMLCRARNLGKRPERDGGNVCYS